METTKKLKCVLEKRAKMLNPEMQRRLRSASQLVVFGSFATGVETKISDLDVFCVGEAKTHFRTPAIEILILPEYVLYSDIWLGSELANHISSFGIPLEERPDWFNLAKVSAVSADRKERRIKAFVQALAKYWNELSPRAHVRYETKIRRELQRLQLLQAGKPVPPTIFLDRYFESETYSNLIFSLSVPGSLQTSIRELFSEEHLREREKFQLP